MLGQFLWTLTLVMALIAVALVLRVISWPKADPRPVPLEIQAPSDRAVRPR